MIGQVGETASYPWARGLSFHQIRLSYQAELAIYRQNWAALNEGEPFDWSKKELQLILSRKSKMDEIWNQITEAPNSVKKSELYFEITAEAKQLNREIEWLLQKT